jgi:hypothetical protein
MTHQRDQGFEAAEPGSASADDNPEQAPVRPAPFSRYPPGHEGSDGPEATQDHDVVVAEVIDGDQDEALPQRHSPSAAFELPVAEDAAPAATAEAAHAVGTETDGTETDGTEAESAEAMSGESMTTESVPAETEPAEVAIADAGSDQTGTGSVAALDGATLATPAAEAMSSGSAAAVAMAAEGTQTQRQPFATEQLSPEWREIQATFVDDPRGAVQLAADAAEAALTALVTSLRERHATLGPAASQDTEELRTALREYRRLCQGIAEVGRRLPHSDATG